MDVIVSGGELMRTTSALSLVRGGARVGSIKHKRIGTCPDRDVRDIAWLCFFGRGLRIGRFAA